MDGTPRPLAARIACTPSAIIRLHPSHRLTCSWCRAAAVNNHQTINEYVSKTALCYRQAFDQSIPRFRKVGPTDVPAPG
jgi:hypothetical protein